MLSFFLWIGQRQRCHRRPLRPNAVSEWEKVCPFLQFHFIPTDVAVCLPPSGFLTLLYHKSVPVSCIGEEVCVIEVLSTKKRVLVPGLLDSDWESLIFWKGGKEMIIPPPLFVAWSTFLLSPLASLWQHNWDPSKLLKAISRCPHDVFGAATAS